MTEGTQHQFGYSWDIYREILPIHEEQFQRWIRPLSMDYFHGRDFLDAGCGMGRNSYWPLRAGAKSGYAFDFDERSLAAARENLKEFPNCRVEYQSIYDIEFSESFDIVFSLGVIQFLADPHKAVANLARALRPGGKLILNVYSHEGNERYLKVFDPIRRHITSRIHPAATRLLAKMCASVIWPFLFLPGQTDYFKMLRRAGFRNVENIIFDQMIPSIANYWTKEEVLALVKGLPLENIELVHVNGISWTLFADRVRQL